jgi:hypothetical protein
MARDFSVARSLPSISYGMKTLTNHLTVVVGGSSLADDLRRHLVQRDVEHVGVAAHLRGVRSTIITENRDVVVLCIVLDTLTVRQFGDDLRRLLQDHHCHPTAVRSIGVLQEDGMHREAVTLGCDVFVADIGKAADLIQLVASTAVEAMDRHWSHGIDGRRVLEREDRMLWSHGVSEEETAARLAAARRLASRLRRDGQEPEPLR